MHALHARQRQRDVVAIVRVRRRSRPGRSGRSSCRSARAPAADPRRREHRGLARGSCESARQGRRRGRSGGNIPAARAASQQIVSQGAELVAWRGRRTLDWLLHCHEMMRCVRRKPRPLGWQISHGGLRRSGTVPVRDAEQGRGRPPRHDDLAPTAANSGMTTSPSTTYEGSQPAAAQLAADLARDGDLAAAHAYVIPSGSATSRAQERPTMLPAWRSRACNHAVHDCTCPSCPRLLVRVQNIDYVNWHL
jgi:hypothetical protein